MKTVAVKFENEYLRGKSYSYLYPYGGAVEKDDLCIVEVNGVFKVVTVVSVEEGRSAKATKAVVCKVEKGAYYDFQEKERKRQNIKTILDKKVKEFNELAVFEMLAKKDSVAADLLKQLKELN